MTFLTSRTVSFIRDDGSDSECDKTNMLALVMMFASTMTSKLVTTKVISVTNY